MSEPGNLILVLLRELRADMAAMEERINARFDQVETRVEARFEAMEKRLDKLHANGLKALQGFIGHRTMVERTMGSFERTMASVENEIAQLKRRVERLESAET